MARLLAAVYLIGLLVLTITPLPHSGTERLSGCIVCGQRGLADGLLNFVLFVPAGFIAAAFIRRPRMAVLAGPALSAAIELLQLVMPGRDPSLGDLVFNSAGALVGVALFRAAPLWRADDPRRRTILAAAWGALVIAVIFLTGWMLQPLPPPPPLTARFAPQLLGMEAYEGRVIGGALGRIRILSGPAAGTERWGPLLVRGAPLGVVTVLAPPAEGLAPLVTFHAQNGADVVLLGLDGDDVVYRQLTRARLWRLDAPSLRLRDAIDSTLVGTTVLIGTAASPVGQCFIIRDERVCGVGHTAGVGWSLLLAKLDRLPVAEAFLNAAWLALIVLPVGWFGRARVTLVVLAVIAWYAWVRVPLDTVLLPATAWDLGGIAAGGLLGILLRRFTPAPHA